MAEVARQVICANRPAVILRPYFVTGRQFVVVALLGSLLLCSQLSAQEFRVDDRVTTTDGSVLKGRIVDETPTQLTLVLASGARVELQKRQIREIKRRSGPRDDASPGGSEKNETPAKPPIVCASVQRSELYGRAAWWYATDHFVVTSVVSGASAEETALRLEQAFVGYVKYFALPAKSGQRVCVYILKDRADFSRCLEQMLSAPSVDGLVGLYHSDLEVVLVYDVVADRDEIGTLENRWRAQLSEFGRTLDTIRTRQMELAEYKERLRWAAVDPAERNRIAGLIETDERKLSAYRSEVLDAMRRVRNAIAHNSKILAQREALMLETLYHECFHAFAARFLHGEGELPCWLNEGLACYFEKSQVYQGELRPDPRSQEYVAAYKAAAAAGKLISLSELLRYSPHFFKGGHRDTALIAYAQSWAVVCYLYGRVPAHRVRAYFLNLQKGAEPITAFEAVMGCSVSEAEQLIHRFIATRRW